MASENQENDKGLKCLFEKFGNVMIRAARDSKKLAEQDPRRIIHCLKVGLTITLVSLFYYFDFFYDGFGVSAMWAVITVVVVFEFSVGATLGRGINRAVATLLGGTLGVAAHRLASFSGEKGVSVILGLCVFFISGVATFVRFFPLFKARHDYGCMVFILTFSLITVSACREDEVLEMAHRRMSTIMIGGCATFFISIFICPVWAGTDLHKLIATNLENLGIFLEGFGCEYFETSDEKNQENKASLDGYKNVLNSRSNEESLVNFAKWEPRHGKFRYRHPWGQYLEIGNKTRVCAYRIDALVSYLNSEMQISMEMRRRIQEPCTKISSECGYALKELAGVIKKMTRSTSVDPHIDSAKTVAENLKLLLQTGPWSETDLLDLIQSASVASLFIEIISCTVKIAESVDELASLSKFKNPVETGQEEETMSPVVEGSHGFGITVE